MKKSNFLGTAVASVILLSMNVQPTYAQSGNATIDKAGAIVDLVDKVVVVGEKIYNFAGTMKGGINNNPVDDQGNTLMEDYTLTKPDGTVVTGKRKAVYDAFGVLPKGIDADSWEDMEWGDQVKTVRIKANRDKFIDTKNVTQRFDPKLYGIAAIAPGFLPFTAGKQVKNWWEQVEFNGFKSHNLYVTLSYQCGGKPTDDKIDSGVLNGVYINNGEVTVSGSVSGKEFILVSYKARKPFNAVKIKKGEPKFMSAALIVDITAQLKAGPMSLNAIEQLSASYAIFGDCNESPKLLDGSSGFVPWNGQKY